MNLGREYGRDIPILGLVHSHLKGEGRHEEKNDLKSLRRGTKRDRTYVGDYVY